MLNFQSLIKADDIRDFEIEGMSIGDSLLDFFDENEIKKNIVSFYKDNKYEQTEFNNHPKLDQYWGVDINFLTNDKKFKIHSIAGVIDYRNKNMQDCIKKMNIIFKELGEVFSGWNKKEIDTRKHIADISGKSKFTSGNYSSKQGYIVVGCHDYAEETGWMDHLSVNIKTREFNDWLGNEAYK
tara:strand:+ start:68 stop:616 length:549 start_codon:yes stop_codon:yes gene_type:complete